MTSKLSVDTIQGVSQAGNITIQGEGTKETNLQQGLAKQWVSLDQTGTAAINDSFNTASVTDNGTGDFNPNFTNNMSSANGYAVSLCCGDSGARFHGDVVNKAAVTSSTYRTYWVNTTNASENDNDIATSIVHGDLA